MDSKNDIENEELPDHTASDRWKGLAEIDQAIHENRLTEYRVTKAWADPWIRLGLIVMIATIAGFAIYVALDEFYY